MGKKGKGKKGKKGKGGKKSKEPQMSAKEAILIYQIQIVEKRFEDVSYEIRGWEEKNKRHLERNDKLKSEQELLVEHLLKQAKEAQQFFASEKMNKSDHVIEAMKEMWQSRRKNETDMEELKSAIAKEDKKIDIVAKDVSYWSQYREIGSGEHATTIRVLEQELQDMQDSFDEMAAHLNKSQDKSRSDVEHYTEETLAKQKDLATEKAISLMNKHSRQEVLDNDWLKREVKIHGKDMAGLYSAVEELEKDNLSIMSKLFECTIDDLKISRNFYLTQFGDHENLDKTGILEMDLAQLTFPEDDDFGKSPEKLVRPKSVTMAAIEEKVFKFALPGTEEDEESTDEEDDVDDAQSTGSELFENLFYEEEDFTNYLQLGPLELKLLNITGVGIPVYRPPLPTEEEQKALVCCPQEWPVTQPMLKSAISHNP